MAKRNHEKDMTEKTLETYEDVYADLMNVLIFGGQQVVSEGDLEQAASFQSDFRIVADYFVQMRKTGVYKALPQEMVHSREVLRLMSVLTKDNRFEQAYNEIKRKSGKEPRTMCEVLERVENRGLQKGRREGRREGLQKGIKEFIGICRKFNVSEEEICQDIMEKFRITKAQAERFMKGKY